MTRNSEGVSASFVGAQHAAPVHKNAYTRLGLQGVVESVPPHREMQDNISHFRNGAGYELMNAVVAICAGIARPGSLPAM